MGETEEGGAEEVGTDERGEGVRGLEVGQSGCGGGEVRTTEVAGESGSVFMVDSGERGKEGCSMAVVKLEAGKEEATVVLVEREGMGVWGMVDMAGVLPAD